MSRLLTVPYAILRVTQEVGDPLSKSGRKREKGGMEIITW